MRQCDFSNRVKGNKGLRSLRVSVVLMFSVEVRNTDYKSNENFK